MEYIITKKKIKNFILRIYPDLTIAVSAPLSATSKDIENFVLSKKEWIEKTLEKLENVISSDALILDKCKSWINLNKEIIEKNMENNFYVDFNL